MVVSEQMVGNTKIIIRDDSAVRDDKEVKKILDNLSHIANEMKMRGGVQNA